MHIAVGRRVGGEVGMWEERVEGKDDTRLRSDMKQWNIRGTLGRMMNIKKKWERIEGAGNKRKRLEGEEEQQQQRQCLRSAPRLYTRYS